MGNVRRWSSSASGNATIAGGVNTINFAEGQAPSTVNNSMREALAQVRGIYKPDEWGWVECSATASVASQTTFKLTGNQTTDYTANRRTRLKSGSTTRYGTIVSSSFTTETTVTITVDSGSLSASHTLAAVAAIDSNHIPANTYVTSNSLSAVLASYITSASASAAFVTSASLATTLGGYVTSNSLSAALATYITSASASAAFASVSRVSGASGAAGSFETWQVLSSDYTNATSSDTAVFTTTGVGAGTWSFEYHMIAQGSDAAVNIILTPSHSGTVTEFVSSWHYTSTATGALTGVIDGATGNVVAQAVEGQTKRSSGSAFGMLVALDTANADIPIVLKGIAVVTASGNLVLSANSNAEGTLTIKDGSHLILKKIN